MKLLQKLPVVVIIFYVALLMGCSGGKNYDIPTTEEMDQFAKVLGGHFEKGAWGKIDDAFDTDEFFERVVKTLDLNFAENDKVKEGFKTMMQEGGFFKRIASQAINGEFLGLRDHKEGKKALYRLELYSGGFNYLELEIIKLKDGSLKIADAYSFALGENISALLSSILLGVMSNDALGLIGGDENGNSKAQRMVKVSKALQEKEYRKVLEIYKELPEEEKKDKFMVIARMQAAQKTDEKEYLDALTNFAKIYPDEAGVNLMMIDKYFLEEKYPESLEAIKKLDKAVGGDPFLELIAGYIYTLLEKPDMAIQSFQKYIKAYPKKPEAYVLLAGLYLDEKNYKSAVQAMLEMKRNTDEHPLHYISLMKYPGLENSPEYLAAKAELEEGFDIDENVGTIEELETEEYDEPSPEDFFSH